MTQEERNVLRSEIERKIKKTESDIEGYKDMSSPVAPDDAIGRVSRMDAINNKSVVEAALREAEQKLVKLRTAQGNIDSPAFGICSRCKTEIPYKRLLFLPESTKCVRCS